MECLIRYLDSTQQGGIIIMYHRDRKRQLGVATEHQLMCAILGNTHSRVAGLLDFSDSLRLASSDKLPLYRWAIDNRDKPTNSSADTLTRWMQLVVKDGKVKPPGRIRVDFALAT
jgi:hypothetical protein